MNTGKTLGIVGGGQLGRMLTIAAKPLGFDVVVLESKADCPAAQVGAEVIIGDLYDAVALAKLAKRCDYLTVEIEHLDAAALQKLADAGHNIHPSPATISLIQDKFAQKQFLVDAGIPVAPFTEITDPTSAESAFKTFGGQLVLKTRYGAYDGRGNALIKNKAQLIVALQQFTDQPLYAEKLVQFVKELAVLVARDKAGKIALYPVVEMFHQRSICLQVNAPAQISKLAEKRALAIAKKTAQQLQGAGVFAIEMFLIADDEILVNEIAPRVHNSGHFSIEGSVTSQFEQHVRAVTGLPLGSTAMAAPAATMVNILGTTNSENGLTKIDQLLQLPNTHLHWYGKSPVKVDRKMGHITVTGATIKQTSRIARQARRRLPV